ncbi:VWA domain-containing protein [Stenotrophomonas rhizophila]|uniref:VWA domain-containing protein n=1 Tax=Stenotrophomonas rhizophila TaxID=216778 RepID=UPI002A6AA1FF|nr:VWA domain-containing protein [Stenotrophomonas rhizophila]MDY0954557.1 VWA domain-containing protein [Stenotrophomonas rhizophila]
MNIDWNALHLVRPQALWLLLALPLIAALWYWRRRRGSAWHTAVDAHLLRHLLVAGGQRAWGGLIALLLGWTLAVVALAGPSWRQVAQPLWQSPAPLVVALDLSSRVTATDLPPSRLLQARAKLAALLRERKGGEVALLVYADDAYTVAPLTADTANVALYLDALGPDVMPRDGQHAERALDAAVLLLQQSGARSGDILLLTDRADAAASSAATAARRQGVTVSVLGVGTPTGAAYRSGDGQIAQARLDEASLRAVASAGGGQYARMASDDGDLRALGVLTPKTSMDDRRDGNGMAWRDEGFWLLPPLMLLSLWAFRRRGLAVVLVACLAAPLALPTPAYAAEGNWWTRADQVDQQALAAGVEAYRRGDFKAAQAQFDGIDSDAGWYNLGNALARQGQYDAAIEAYDKALRKTPGMPDAVANRAAVDAARKRKPPSAPPKDGQGKQPPTSPPSQGQGQPGKDAGQPPKQPGQQSPGQPPGTPAQGKDKDKDTQGAGNPDPNPAAQAQADAAQRQQMQQALQRQGKDGKDTPAQRQAAETPQQREQRQAVEAWMRRVPDDPGSLLRAKFQLENERRKREGR